MELPGWLVDKFVLHHYEVNISPACEYDDFIHGNATPIMLDLREVQ